MRYIGPVMLATVCLLACSETPDGQPQPNTAFKFDAPRQVETLGFSAALDALFQRDGQREPGCVVGVARDGRFLHAKGYGAANLDYGIPLGPDSVFRAGSLAKQFTAHAVALLALRQHIDLDADIHTYLPDLVDYGHPVTVRQMVHHVAGMGDYGFDPARFERAPGKPFRFGNQDYYTTEEFYDAARVQPLEHAPGTGYLYSNLAYFLLGQMIERVTGESLRSFTQREFFAPLGMKDTFFNDNVNDVVQHRATGYRPRPEGGFEVYETNHSWVGNGGLYTTVNDLLKWDRAFRTGAVPGGDEAVELVTTPDAITLTTMESALLDEGPGYGFGLQLGTYKGHRVHAHGGAWVGFRALYARFPDDQVSVMLLCNRLDGRPREVMTALLDHALTLTQR